jgi:Zn-dependent protease
MNIALAFVSLTLAGLWIVYAPFANPLHENVMIFLIAGGWLNIALALLNLLPIPPLDGSNILAGFSDGFDRLRRSPQAQMFGMFVLMAVFISGVGRLLFHIAQTVSDAYLDGLITILPRLN